MTDQSPEDFVSLADRLGIPIPEAYRAGVTDAYAQLLEQAVLVMSAPTPKDADGSTEFMP